MKTAVDMAKETARASSTTDRASGRRRRASMAAVVPDRVAVSGRASRATTGRPWLSASKVRCHSSRTAPIHSRAGPRKAQYDTEMLGTPSGARTSAYWLPEDARKTSHEPIRSAKSRPYRSHQGDRECRTPSCFLVSATVTERRSRKAGTRTAPAATTAPSTKAIAYQTVHVPALAPNEAAPKARRPVSAATPSPERPPARPIRAASRPAKPAI